MGIKNNKFGVFSEIGKLRRVLVCRPGLAHERLTPSNCNELLYDDVLWVDKAIEDHRHFVGLMESQDVEVIEFRDLIRDILKDKKIKDTILKRKINTVSYMDAYQDIYNFLIDLSDEKLSEYLIGGLLKKEITNKISPIYDSVVDDYEFILKPLPNTVFTRDTSAWLYNGVNINAMHWSVRRGETFLLDLVYRNHPMFTNENFEIYMGHEDRYPSNFSIEGGDIMPVGNKTVFIGMSERSTYSAIYELAKTLFKKGEVDRVVIIKIPKKRSSMHIDTIFTFCDVDAISIYPNVVEDLECFSLYPTDHEDKLDLVIEKKGLFHVLNDVFKIKKWRVIETGGNSLTREREQWDDANNVVCLKPGLVMGYDRNKYTLEQFKNKGIEVMEVPSSELGRGRGGAHCMTCPILRDGV